MSAPSPNATSRAQCVLHWARSVIYHACESDGYSSPDDRARYVTQNLARLNRDLPPCYSAIKAILGQLHRLRPTPEPLISVAGIPKLSAHEAAWELGYKIWCAGECAARAAWGLPSGPGDGGAHGAPEIVRERLTAVDAGMVYPSPDVMARAAGVALAAAWPDAPVLAEKSATAAFAYANAAALLSELERQLQDDRNGWLLAALSAVEYRRIDCMIHWEAARLLPGNPPATPVVAAGVAGDAAGNDPSVLSLLKVFTNGIADERIKKAALILEDSSLRVNEKLTKINDLMPFPFTASAEQLGKLLGVSKQAVIKTDWWDTNRKGEKTSEIGRRRKRHQERAGEYERPDPTSRHR